jgi:hypothetical protein
MNQSWNSGNFRAASASFDALGKKYSSNGGKYGTGVSGAVTRTVGLSKSSKAFSAISAASSPTMPPVHVSSCRRLALLHLRTLATTVRVIVGQ